MAAGLFAFLVSCAGASSGPPATAPAAKPPPPVATGEPRVEWLETTTVPDASLNMRAAHVELPVDGCVQLPPSAAHHVWFAQAGSGWVQAGPAQAQLETGTGAYWSGSRPLAIHAGAQGARLVWAAMGDPASETRTDPRAGMDAESMRCAEEQRRARRKSGAPRPAGWIEASLDGAPELQIANGLISVKILLDASQGAQRAGLSELVAQPGASVPEHEHPGSAEALVILQGRGHMKLKNHVVGVEPGQFLFVPPGTLHSMEVRGEKPVRALQMYTPPGPEQRFRKLAQDSERL